MALWSITGSAIVVYEKGVIPNQDLDGGVIRLAGAIADTTKWTDRRLGDNAYDHDVNKPISGIHTDAINNQGVFAGGDQVIRLVTTDLAGVANTTLRGTQSNSAERSKSPKPLRSMRTVHTKLALATGAWSEVEGNWEGGFPVNAQSGIWNINTSSDVSATANTADDAANPSRAVPGEYIFLVGGKTLSSGNYEAKNT